MMVSFVPSVKPVRQEPTQVPFVMERPRLTRSYVPSVQKCACQGSICRYVYVCVHLHVRMYVDAPLNMREY
jgi:hypothetical protein